MKARKFLELNKFPFMSRVSLCLRQNWDRIPIKHLISQLGDAGIQLFSWGVTHSFKFHSPVPTRVHLPFPSPFSTMCFTASGAGAAVINIHSIPLVKAGVSLVSCNSPVHHPSPANSSSTARAKLPVKQTALQRDGTAESRHRVTAVPTCQGVSLTAGSAPCGKGEADHTPSSKTRSKWIAAAGGSFLSIPAPGRCAICVEHISPWLHQCWVAEAILEGWAV